MNEPKQDREIWSEKYPGSNYDNHPFAKLNNILGYEKTGRTAELQGGPLLTSQQWLGLCPGENPSQ